MDDQKRLFTGDFLRIRARHTHPSPQPKKEEDQKRQEKPRAEDTEHSWADSLNKGPILDLD